MPTARPDDRSPVISRRQLLGAAAAGASALALAGTTLGDAASAAAEIALRQRVPRDPSQSGIDHVVVVMMENRSFDHMLGWLPGAKGRQIRKFADRNGVKHPTWHLDTFTGLGFNDPSHSYNGGREEFNGGACDGWLRAGSNDIFSIGYYTGDDLDFYRNAAPYWTTCDRFFASIMGPTYPNRFYMHAGQTDRRDNRLDLSTLPTIWDSLQAAGIDGRYYYSDLPFSALWGQHLSPISSPYADFLTACSTGSLPAVSFVDPRFFTTAAGPQADDHPHADIRLGQQFLNEVYQAVTASPNWPTTLMFIVYDEWGGFFDHIRPAVAPDSDPLNGLRGFRIPALIIGPRVRRNNIESRIYDPTSILRMIEWRWGLPPLAPRDAAARNIAEALDWSDEPDLTAPQWSVPATDELTPLVASSLASTSRAFDEQQQAHLHEWTRVGDLAAANGFAV
jgi:phospholipase C